MRLGRGDRPLGAELVVDFGQHQRRDDGEYGRRIGEAALDAVEHADAEQQQDHRLGDLLAGDGDKAHRAGTEDRVRAELRQPRAGLRGGEARGCVGGWRMWLHGVLLGTIAAGDGSGPGS